MMHKYQIGVLENKKEKPAKKSTVILNFRILECIYSRLTHFNVLGC